jgi:UPF0042 nucleotide-binding protein
MITNADAGTSDRDSVGIAVDVLRAGCEVEVAASQDPGELDRILRGAGDRMIVVAGGDGSLHAVIAALHAEDDVLLRRYAETRRRHPLAGAGVSLADAIAEERRLLHPLIDSADLVIDTSRMSMHELRDQIVKRVEPNAPGRLSILFESFGYKHGMPGDADFVFDARTLPNPYWEPALKPLTGRDVKVVEFLESSPRVEKMLADLIRFIEGRLPEYEEANRGYLTVAIGCTGGQHRSVYLVERLAAHFRARYPQLLVRHNALPQ